MSTDMTLPKLAILTMGVYGVIIRLLSDQAEISFLTTKNLDTYRVISAWNSKELKSNRQKAFDKLILNEQ